MTEFDPEDDTPLRLYRVELLIAELIRDRDAMQRTIRAWTMALAVAMIGATMTLVVAGLSAAVAYGELRQSASANSAALQDIRSDLRARLGADTRAARPLHSASSRPSGAGGL